MNYVKTLILLATISLTGLAYSQPFGPPPGRGPEREQVRERIKTLKIWKLTEELDLSSEVSQQFFPIYNEFADDIETIHENIRIVVDSLEAETHKAEFSEARINDLNARLSHLRANINKRMDEFRETAGKILTPLQVGRLIVFEIRFQENMRDIARDVRREMNDGRRPRH